MRTKTLSSDLRVIFRFPCLGGSCQDRVKFPSRQTCRLPHEIFVHDQTDDFQEPHKHLIHTCSAAMKTTWKEIPPVPTSSEFLDVVLSRTQRRLPTQIRAGFQISRIRNFYTRKVKYTQETFTEKLSLILGPSGAVEAPLSYIH